MKIDGWSSSPRKVDESPPKRIIRQKRIILPDFLVIGHITLDLLDQGSRPGGTAAYAAVTAQRLGLNTALVTAAGPELDLKEVLPSIEVSIVISPKTTCYRNLYPPQG
ncbi:MAG: hypothetical protein HYX86_05430, partial [Chloroflexi bacterium]|nr:hypothetical protein [Chloroflexota bacterium]